MGRPGFPGGSVVRTPPASAEDARDTGSIPGSGRSPGGGNGNLPQYACLENPMDRGAWQATVHGLTKSWMWLSTAGEVHQPLVKRHGLECRLCSPPSCGLEYITSPFWARVSVYKMRAVKSLPAQILIL